MKLITLNTHSWLEEAPLEKLEQMAQYIYQADLDFVGLQEVNQGIHSPEGVVDECYISAEELAIKEDNFALLLVARLKELGLTYYWTWVCSHVGYDRYHEGVALLSKYPITPEGFLVSKIDDLTNYRRRKQLGAKVQLEDDSIYLWVCHYSWWEAERTSGFAYEWQQSLKVLAKENLPTLLMGDFNTPAHLANEGYQLVTETYRDAFLEAEKTQGSFTVEETIDGWEENTEKLRIDFVFHSEHWKVNEYAVIFNGVDTPIVSDHYGVMVEFDLVK